MKNNIPKQKHVPMRTCIVSRVKKPKNDLIRIVKTHDNKVVIDLKGKLKGRGANIDMDIQLFDKAIEKGFLSRALKLESKLKPEEIEILRNEFEKAIEEKNFRKGNKPVKIRVTKADILKISNDESEDI